MNFSDDRETNVTYVASPVKRTAAILRLCGDSGLFTADGLPLARPLRTKALALLAYLALEPGPHSREKLTTLLWGEYPDEKARASLRQVLRHLRHALGDAIEMDRRTVNLVRDAIACDATELLRFLEHEGASSVRSFGDNLRQALAVDVQSFLRALTVRNSPVYEEWAAVTRAQLIRRYVLLLASAAREALAQRAWRECIQLAQRWAALAPFDEEPMGLIIEAQFLAGDASDALGTYTEFATRLAAEAHRAPGRALVELAARIRHEATSRAARSSQATNVRHEALSFTGSLIGRSSQWEALNRAWRDVRDGVNRVVLIEGEHGAGKTRLADDFLRWIGARGGTVLRGAGYDAHAGAPFGAVIEALRSGLGAPGLAGADPESLAQVARLLPELRVTFPGIAEALGPGQAAESWRLFEAVAQVLLAVAEESPTVIFIDDLQWCDANSCSLIQFLIRRTSEASVLWCVAFTAGEIARDAPPARLFRKLRTAANAVAIPLGPLGEEDVRRLILDLGRITSPTAGRRLAARIHAVSAGNPLYAIELLKTLFARGLLAVDPATGAWLAGSRDDAGTTAPPLSPTVHEAIAERIESLPDELHGVLATIAVAGRGCAPRVVSHVHGISRLRAAALGDALIDRHWVLEENGDYRCAHPILADVVRSRLGTSRRREIHRALALTLELLLSSSGSSDGEMGEIARHAEQAGDRAMAYRYALLAADACSQRCAFEDSLAWLDLAKSCAESVEEFDVARRQAAVVFEAAGWCEAPLIPAPGGPLAARVDLADLDLPATTSTQSPTLGRAL